jgi:hypothetical protein
MSLMGDLHQRAAEHHEHAAPHHREAARLQELKDRVAGAYQSHLAADHQAYAVHYAAEAARNTARSVAITRRYRAES